MPTPAPRVVVVEDDGSLSQAIERVLRAAGFTPVMFASAEAALACGDAATADCLVLDVRLPAMSGFELYRQLAAAGPEPPAIFVTAHDDRAVREEAERLGARDYLPKPFTGRRLLDAITQALSSH